MCFSCHTLSHTTIFYFIPSFALIPFLTFTFSPLSLSLSLSRYLFPGAETDQEVDITTEEIITASGKMVMLDRLLEKLKKKGHRVVIFSQYTRTLDIINDYLGNYT